MEDLVDYQRGVTPEPGVYYNVPSEVYHTWRAASSHTLNLAIDRSMAHVYEKWNTPEARTDAMRIGDALHTLALEPSAFGIRYLLAEPCCAVVKSGDRAGEPCGHPGKFFNGTFWFCGTHGKGKPDADEPANALSEEHVKVVTGMADALRCHWRASQLLTPARQTPVDYAGHNDGNEVTIVWDRPTRLDDGTTYLLRCKLRADILRPAAGICGDIKTAENASPEAFRKSCEKYGYHRQGAHYLEGIAAAGIPGVVDYAFLVPEKESPYKAAVYQLDDEALECGRRELEPAYRAFARAERDGDWTGYSEDFQVLSLSPWRLKTAGI